jgi:hypothetical protein
MLNTLGAVFLPSLKDSAPTQRHVRQQNSSGGRNHCEDFRTMVFAILGAPKH